MRQEDIDSLVEKYMAAETDLEEEQQLRDTLVNNGTGKGHDDLRALFGYYGLQKTHTPIPAFINPATEIPKPRGRVINIQWITVAASVAIVVMAIFFLNRNHEAILTDTYTDPTTAAQSAVEALELLSSEINKGQTMALDQLKEFDNFNKYLNIF